MISILKCTFIQHYADGVQSHLEFRKFEMPMILTFSIFELFELCSSLFDLNVDRSFPKFFCIVIVNIIIIIIIIIINIIMYYFFLNNNNKTLLRNKIQILQILLCIFTDYVK